MQKYLISKDTKGKIRIVDISFNWNEDEHAYEIIRYTGQLNGKMTEQPVIYVRKGKVSRTVTEQVKLEFNSKVSKYLDKGYKEFPKNPNTSTKEELDSFLPTESTDSNGNLKPMLAKDFNKVSTSVLEKHMWYASRKLDGVRCIMFKKDGYIQTSSRGGKDYFESTLHITTHPKLVEFFNSHPNIILDGELYVHGLSLQKISGLTRTEKDVSNCHILQYYIYDVVDTQLTCKDRMELLEDIAEILNLTFDPNQDFKEDDLKLQIVPQEQIKGWDAIHKIHNKYVSEGFEGAVLRNPDKLYGVGKRTNDMIKVKEYQDEEFEITGYSEGLRPEDMVFTCITNEGKTFEAKPIGPRELKYEYLERMDEIIGKMATVKFFGYSDVGIPTQTTLKCIRDYE